MKTEAIRLHSEGLTKRQIADTLGLSYATVKNYTKGLTTVIPNSRYICKDCGTAGQEHFYKNAPYQCKPCWNKRTYKTTKDKISEYMEIRGGAKCQRCGYDKYIGALEFHHRNPLEKDPSWSRGWNLEKLAKELNKCDILCANCHREVHAELRSG